MVAAAERPTTDDRIRAALWFAERGFGVFTVWSTDADGTCRCPRGRACDNAGKHPITPHGFQDATTDVGRIRTLLSAGSEPNYGLVCPEGVFALDVDGELVARLAALEEELGPLPPSLRTVTAHGFHAFFRWPAELPRPIGQMFGMVTRWGSGRDAGYVIGPRSVHASGKAYAPAGVADIATLPEAWALRTVGPAPAVDRTVTIAPGGYELPERVGAGESRYEAIRDYTAHLYNRGFDVDEMWLLVRDRLAPRFAEGLSEPDVRSRFERTVAGLETRLGERRAVKAPTAVPLTPEQLDASSIDAADLLELEIPPLEWIVPGLIPEGTTILAGPPKLGKSCLVYQIAVEVALGGDLLGRHVQQGDVLYLALEDGKRRGQSRLKAVLADRVMPRGHLEVRWSASKIGAGLEEELLAWLDAHPRTRLVAIDTLQKVRARGDARRNAYEVDVEDLGRLQDLFRDRAVGLLVVHHSKKDAGDDFLASVSGTYGITGSADTTLVIQRKRLETYGKLVVTGRDVEELEQSVAFNGMTWTEAPDVLPDASFEQSQVYNVIAAHGPIFASGIAEKVHGPLPEDPTDADREQRARERDAVQKLVNKLSGSGAIVRSEDDRGWIVAALRVVIGGANEAESGSRALSAPSDPRARARAGVATPSAPSAPSDGSGEGAEGRGTRTTRAGLQAREAEPIVQVEATPTQSMVCHFYADHRFEHRFVDGRWICPICDPGTQVPA